MLYAAQVIIIIGEFKAGVAGKGLFCGAWLQKRYSSYHPEG
jgi:hypothetical protein